MIATTALLAGCNDDGSTLAPPAPPPSAPAPDPTPVPTGLLVGGQITGIAVGNRVVLANGTDTIALTADGAFAFRDRVQSGSTYRVTVSSMSMPQDCSILRESGTVTDTDVTTVQVTCGPSDHAFRAAPSMLAPRIGLRLLTMLDGTVLAVGGTVPDGGAGTAGDPIASVERLDPISGQWIVAGNLPADARVADAIPLDSGRVFIVTYSDGPNRLMIFDLATGSAVAAPPTVSINLFTIYGIYSLRLLDGRILIYNGASVEIYDPLTNRWKAGASPVRIRDSNSLVLLESGDVLFAGGSTGVTPTTDCELYDVANDRWTVTGSTTIDRGGAAPALLPGGKVLLVGGSFYFGRLGSTVLSKAEIYDPATGSWSATNGLATLRENFAIQLMPNGKILVVGGNVPSVCTGANTGFGGCSSVLSVPTSLASSEVFDPATSSWSAGPPLLMARSSPRATLTRRGQLIVTSGTTAVPFTTVVNPFGSNWNNVLVSTSEIGG